MYGAANGSNRAILPKRKARRQDGGSYDRSREALIDDALRDNVFGLLMSLNMLIEFGEAFDYSAAAFEKWCREVGFRCFEVIHLAGSSSAAIAYK
jgi:hypothetical protein